MVFVVKKLLNVGLDLTLWQKGIKKPPERNEWQICGFRLSLAGCCQQTCRCQHLQALLRQHLVPWVQRIYPFKKCAFWRILCRSAPQKPSAAVGGIPIFGGLAAIFAGLEFAGHLYLMCFAGKVQAMPHSNLAALCPSITAEWDWLAAVYICKTCPSFCRH
jgi:hypothetical protein